MGGVTTINYNQSRVKMFRRCQRQYSFRYDYPVFLGVGEGLEMVPSVSKLPLYRGTWMHALQEALHYQWAGIDEFKIRLGQGKNKVVITAHSWKDVHAALTEEFNELFLEEREDLGDLPEDCENLFKSYLRFWSDDQERYTVAEVDGKPAIELVIEADMAKFGIKNARFKGRIDLVVEDIEYDGYWIWDAKWVGKVPAPDERMMSPQSILYVWALREKYGLDVRGFLYNYGRTKPPAIPQLLKKGTLSVKKSMDTDQHTYLREIKKVHGDKYKRYLPYYREKLLDLKGREALWFDRQRIPIELPKQVAAIREYVASIRDIQRRERRREYIPRSYFFNCKFSCDYHGPCVAEFAGLDIDTLVKADYQFVPERYDKKDEEPLNA
jgi:hypothetical protein